MTVKQVSRKRSWKAALRRDLPFHLLLLPALVVVIIYRYLPMAGVTIAFQDYTPILPMTQQTWVGLDNFIELFAMPQFWKAVRNTVVIAVMKIITDMIFPVVFALLLAEVRNKFFKSTVQTVAFLPHFIAWVALAGIFSEVLSTESGILNKALGVIGIKPIYFLGDEKVFPFTIVFTAVWKHFGWNAIVYLAAITNVDNSLYEAAYLDGAGRFKQVLHVTLPAIMPMVVLMTVLGIGNILKAGFEQVFTMYSSQVYSTGDIIDTFVYRLGLVDFQFSMASAVGLFQSVISFALMMLGYYLADRVAGYRVF